MRGRITLLLLGVPNPADPTGISRIGDAAVFGLTPH
jgi:hypothetical protein